MNDYGLGCSTISSLGAGFSLCYTTPLPLHNMVSTKFPPVNPTNQQNTESPKVLTSNRRDWHRNTKRRVGINRKYHSDTVPDPHNLYRCSAGRGRRLSCHSRLSLLFLPFSWTFVRTFGGISCVLSSLLSASSILSDISKIKKVEESLPGSDVGGVV